MNVNKRSFGTWVLIILLSVAALCADLSAQKKKTVKDLPPQYRKWLEEEVVYIITTKERDVFLQLDSDRERNIFIEAFWKQRNPDPNSSENAFRIEHYKRIAFANQWLGQNSPTPGWRTDRGRVYILLGQPKEIQAYENLYDLRPVDHLVLRRHGRIRPAGLVLRGLLEEGHRGRLPALFPDQRRAAAADAALRGRHDRLPPRPTTRS